MLKQIENLKIAVADDVATMDPTFGQSGATNLFFKIHIFSRSNIVFQKDRMSMPTLIRLNLKILSAHGKLPIMVLTSCQLLERG